MSSVWQPMSLRDAVNRLMEDSFVRSRFAGGTTDDQAAALPLPLDVASNEEALIITANLPGVRPEDVDISIEGDTLTIRGEFKRYDDNQQDHWLMQELYHGPFMRALRLNIPVQVDKVRAVFKDGVLTLTLPKAEKIRPKVIKVKGG